MRRPHLAIGLGVLALLAGTTWIASTSTPSPLAILITVAGITLVVVGSIRQSSWFLDSPRKIRSRRIFGRRPAGQLTKATIAQQLAQLSDLHLMGALDDREFSEAKAIVIAGIQTGL